MRRDKIASVFPENILWEVPIQVAAKDFLSDGTTVFDVGANVGGLTVAFSRLVGVEGRVYSFECNPMIIPVLKRTIEVNNCANVRIVEKAVFSENNLTMQFGIDPSYYSSGSGLEHPNFPSQVRVKTVTLDRFSEENQVVPSFIKIDVEGAEFHVLLGSSALVSDNRPVLVFEYFFINDHLRDPMFLLQKHGYRFIDVNLLEEVSRSMYANERFLSNILAVPEEKFKGYRTETVNKSVQIGEVVSLTPGRYRFDVKIAGSQDSEGMVRIFDRDRGVLSMFHAGIEQLCHHSCSSLVLFLEEQMDLTIDVIAIRGHVRGCGAEVRRVVREY
jgi:FkbM family methyltransferase